MIWWIFTIVEWLLCFCIFIIYYKSSSIKIRNPYAFVLIVNEYNISSWSLTMLIAPLLSVMELITAVWIIIPQTRTLGLIVGGLLQMLFILILSKNLGKTFHWGCGCFEINNPRTITRKHIYLNISIVLIILFLLIIREHSYLGSLL